jgi:pilus assembly protein CpaB
MLLNRRAGSIGAALMLSAVAVGATQHRLNGEIAKAAAAARANPQAAPPPVRVLVAREALPAGTVLKPGQLRWQAWPANGSTAGYYTAAAATPEQFAGAVVRGDLGPGEPLTAARVIKPGARGFMAAVLRPGYRAVTLNVSASTGVAGFVFPGDRVDLILTRVQRGGGPDPKISTSTVLSDVRVVGVDQKLANPKGEVIVPQTATLEVTPSQAELVAAAGDSGKLSLSLRSLGAPDALAAETLAVPRLANAAPRSPARRRPAALHTQAPSVEVVRGTQSATAPAPQS